MNTENKDIIVYLITTEMRWTQFHGTLADWDMEPEDLHQNMLEVIQPLMGIKAKEGEKFPQVSEKFGRVYLDGLYRVRDFPNLIKREELEPLAEACYYNLVACLKFEKKRWIELS